MRHPRLLSVAALGAVALTTASCSAAAPAAEGPVELTYWTWTAGAEATVDAFNAAQDDIEVVLEVIPSGAEGYTKIANAITADEAPDVVTVEYNRLPEFASQGLLTDITDAVADFNDETFPTGIVDLVTLGGASWAVPYDAAPMVLYYRADLFEEWGIEVPTTWEEYRAAAERIAAEHPESRITNLDQGDSGLLPVLAWQTGESWFQASDSTWTVDIDNAGSQQVAAYWDAMIADGLVSSEKGWSEEETKARLDGSIATIIGASWSAGSLSTTLADMAGQWRAAALPSWDGVPASGNYGGTSFTIPEGSENEAAAVEFIEWVTTDPAAITARVESAETPSSSLPANPEAREVAAAAFDTTWLGGQDLFALTSELADEAVVPGWAWGPAQTVTDTALREAAAAADFASALAAAQTATVDALEERGLTVSE